MRRHKPRPIFDHGNLRLCDNDGPPLCLEPAVENVFLGPGYVCLKHHPASHFGCELRLPSKGIMERHP